MAERFHRAAAVRILLEASQRGHYVNHEAGLDALLGYLASCVPEAERWRCKRCGAEGGRGEWPTRFGIMECGRCMRNGGLVDLLERIDERNLLAAQLAAAQARVAELDAALAEQRRAWEVDADQGRDREDDLRARALPEAVVEPLQRLKRRSRDDVELELGMMRDLGDGFDAIAADIIEALLAEPAAEEAPR